jgi:hypothetical protein
VGIVSMGFLAELASAIMCAILVLSLSNHPAAAAGSPQAEAGGGEELGLGDGQGWSFLGGAWQQDESGVIIPHQGPEDENLAVNTSQAYRNLEAEFEFRADSMICGAGFVFRAQDPRHYYLVHFPYTGQQYRAEHFWAAVSKVDDSGWEKVLRMDLVSGCPSELGIWHRVKLQVRGNEIRLWVNGRPFPVVTDDTYAGPGYVGLYSYAGLGPGARTVFRHVRIRGTAEPAPAWDESLTPVRNWFNPYTATDYPVQHGASFARTRRGELLMKLWLAQEFHGSSGVSVLMRSSDKGRTWSAGGKLPEALAPGVLFGTKDGRLYLFKSDYEQPHLTISRAASSDEGKTWSEWSVVAEKELTTRQFWMNGPPVELQDDTLLWFGVARTVNTVGTQGGIYYEDNRSPGEMNFCLRSSDGGARWSDPINTDGPNPTPSAWQYAKDNHVSEISGGETREGKVLAFVRSIISPWVWETWSEDGGQTWTPWSRGPFGLWANSQIVRTASGALLIGGRHPGLAVQASFDDGMSWHCYRIDTAFYANGQMYEVEPNVVLFMYSAKYSDTRIRAQLLRVTDHGLEPVRPVQ